MQGLLGGLPPGLAGFVAQRQTAGHEQNQQLQQMQGLLGMQTAQIQQGLLSQQLADKQKRQQQMDAYAATLSPQDQALFRVSPEAVIKAKTEKRVLAPGATLLGPGNVPEYTAPNKPDKVTPSNLSKLYDEYNAIPEGDPRKPIFAAAIKKAATHQPSANTNVTVKQESEFGKTVGKEFGEIYTGSIKAEFNAPKVIANYDRLGNLLSQVNTGKFTGTTTELKAAAKALGVDLTAMGIRDDVAPAQATKQISNMLALELRNPAGGAGMPGAMSDKDREFLQQSIPSIENDPGAIGEMIKYRKLLAKRDQEVGKLARDYRRRTGKFDEGFFDELRDFSEKNPLFPQSATPGIPPMSAIDAEIARRNQGKK